MAAREVSADFPEQSGASKDNWSNEFSDIPDPGDTPPPSDRIKPARRKTGQVSVTERVIGAPEPADSAFVSMLKTDEKPGGRGTSSVATGSGVRKSKHRSTGMFTRTISANAPAQSNVEGTFDELTLEDENIVREYRFGSVGWFHKVQYIVGVTNRRVLARVRSSYFFGLIGGGSTAYSEFPVAGPDCLEGTLTRPPVGIIAWVALLGGAISTLLGMYVGVNDGVIGGLVTAVLCLLLVGNFGKIRLSYGSLRVLVNNRFTPFAIEVMKEIHRQRLAYRERIGVLAIVDRPRNPRFDFRGGGSLLRRTVWFALAAAALGIGIAVLAHEPTRASAATWLESVTTAATTWIEGLRK
jgi:hypothetical protein